MVYKKSHTNCRSAIEPPVAVAAVAVVAAVAAVAAVSAVASVEALLAVAAVEALAAVNLCFKYVFVTTDVQKFVSYKFFNLGLSVYFLNFLISRF